MIAKWYIHVHYIAKDYELSLAQPIQASFSNITGVDPINE